MLSEGLKPHTPVAVQLLTGHKYGSEVVFDFNLTTPTRLFTVCDCTGESRPPSQLAQGFFQTVGRR